MHHTMALGSCCTRFVRGKWAPKLAVELLWSFGGNPAKQFGTQKVRDCNFNSLNVYNIRTHNNDSSYWLFTGFTSCEFDGWTPLPKTSSSMGSLWIGQTSVHPSLPTMTMVAQLLVLSSSSEPELLRAIKVQAGPREAGILAYCRFEANYLPVPSSERRRVCADRLCSWADVARFSLSMMISPSLSNCTLVLPITPTCVNLLSEREKIYFTALRHNCFQVVLQKEEITWLRSSQNCIWSHQVGE